jgi:carboxyl-terminal processing protease
VRPANIIHNCYRITNHSIKIIYFCAFLAGCHHQQNGANSGATQTNLVVEDEVQLQTQTFDYVWERINSTYYDPNMGGVDWLGAGEELRPLAMTCTTSAELRPILNELINRLGESHFAIVPGENNALANSLQSDSSADSPQGEEMIDQTSGLWTNGIDLRMVENESGVSRATVFRLLDDSAAEISGVESGWILQSINGESVEDLISAVSGAIANPQSPSEEPDSLDFFVASSLNTLVNGDLGEPVNMRLLDRNDSPQDLSISPLFREGVAVRLGHLPEVISQFSAEIIEPAHLGLIQFDIFLGPIIPQFTEAIRLFNEAEVNGLVIDVRGNPGGISGMAAGIAGHLISSRDQSLGEMYDRESRLNLPVFPRPRSQRFEGPVAVLVDELSASTSEFLAAGIQDLNRGKIFGQTTAGMALPSTIESLPNGDLMQFVIFNMIRSNGERIEGYGVTPDEIVPLTRAALISGEDPALNSAINWILETP